MKGETCKPNRANVRNVKEGHHQVLGPHWIFHFWRVGSDLAVAAPFHLK